MRLGIVVSTSEPEVAWNAFRFGVTSLKAQHEVKIFLINRGVEVEDITDARYDIKEQIHQFVEDKGKILACGTCLKSREKSASAICPISTMKDLLKLVEESEKLLTFG